MNLSQTSQVLYNCSPATARKRPLLSKLDALFGRVSNTDNSFVPALLTYLFLIIRYCSPTVTDNEMVRAAQSLRSYDPTYLLNDWSYSTPEYSSFFFDYCCSFLHFLPLPFSIVTGRLLLGLLFTLACFDLFKTLKIKPAAVFLGIFTWINLGQILIAGEFLVLSLEPKCFSYPMLIFAISNVCKHKILRAGIFLCASIAFHPMVGLWGGLPLLLTSFLLFKAKNEKFDISISALAFSAIAFIYFLFNLAVPSFQGLAVDKNDFLYVYFRNPHHLDPVKFTNIVNFSKLVIVSLVSFFAGCKVLSQTHKKIIFGFFSGLLLIFVFGYLAHFIGFVSFLKTYPFRIYPALLLMFGWVFVASLLLRTVSAAEPKFKISMAPKAALVLCITIFISGNFLRELFDLTPAWKSFAQEGLAMLEPPATLIKSSTPAGAIVAFPPWRTSIWFYSGRATFVSTKFHPPYSMAEWYARLLLANGNQEFKSKWPQIENELRRNYPNLSKDILSQLCREHGVSYYYTEAERPDLIQNQVFGNKFGYLYKNVC